MTRPYSVDLRERVVRQVETGESVRRVAAMFAVSPQAGDGTWSILLGSTWQRIGATCICGRAVRPSPSRATAKAGAARGPVAGTGAAPGRNGGHRRLRNHRRQRGGRGSPVAGRGQSPPDPRFRPRHRQAVQDRPDRCRGNRSFCRGGPPARPADCRRASAGARRAGGTPPPGHRDDGRRAQSPAPGDPTPGSQRDRPASRAVAERALRTRSRHRRRDPQQSGLASRCRSLGQRPRHRPRQPCAP